MTPFNKTLLTLQAASALAWQASGTVLLDDTWADGTRANQNLPTDSAWYCSSSSALVAAANSMTLTVGSSAVLALTYFGTNSADPVALSPGDTLLVTVRFTFNGINAGSTSQNFRIGLFDFADSTLSPKWATGDGFSNSSQGAGTRGYALFQNMGAKFNSANPIDIRKRTTVGDSSLLGSSGDYTSLGTGPGNTNNFSGFVNSAPYTLQLSAQRTSTNSLVITASWSSASATLTTTVVDAAPGGFNFDGVALRPQDSTSTASTIIFNEVKVEVVSSSTPPGITTQPQNQTVFVNQNAGFSVVANGTTPLSYQWYYNTNSALTDATNAMLTLTNVQTTNAGGYSVVVANSIGAVTSTVATLTVNVPVAPSFTTQPQSQTVSVGQTATFTAAADGTAPLSFQWYYNTSLPVANATNATFVLTNVQPPDAGAYSVVVANLAGSITSTDAVLTVDASPLAPSFVNQPTPATAVVGGSASFAALASGTAPISYLWQKNGTNVAGATAATLTLTNVQLSDAGSYALTATNSVGGAVSSPAQLTVTVGVAVPLSAYNLTGFGQATTGGGLLAETNSGYRKVYDAVDLAVALSDKKGIVKVIEIMNDLNLGYNEIPADAKTNSEPFRAHNAPQLHPALIQAGVSLIDIQGKNGLTLFSANGATIRHATFNLKNSGNIMVRNLKFDEMWEWDEASKGQYDNNDWDFIDLGNSGTVSNIWIDHCTFTKSYDGIVDIKGGSFNITFSWCKYAGDDGASNTNSFVRQQLNFLEQNRSAYPMYSFLRNNGFSLEDIVTVIQGHDKTHLIGATTDPINAQHTITLHHEWFVNPWDRLPRLRAGNVHCYNLYVDDTLGLGARRLRNAREAAMSGSASNTLNNTYSFKPFLNGTISTEGGATLVEKSVYIDCLTPLRNNQTDPNDPTYTGKIMALDTIYQMDDTNGMPFIIRGNSTDPGSPLGPFQAPIIPFSWNLPNNQLPYTYTPDDPSQLEAMLTDPSVGAGAGVLSWNKTNWLKTTYPLLTGFAQWQSTQFTAQQLANASISGPQATPAGDGVANFVKYALGVAAFTPAAQPLVSFRLEAGSGVLGYQRPTVAPDVAYDVQVSSDLLNWSGAGITQQSVGSANGLDRWEARYTGMASTTLYFRLRLQGN